MKEEDFIKAVSDWFRGQQEQFPMPRVVEGL